MQVVLLRVGIDTASGGILAPVFRDGSFEYIPIPDHYGGAGVDRRTYANSLGRSGQALIHYFPKARRGRASEQPIHFDPEFESFTYGDPTPPKASLRDLTEGSLLVFYAGLKGWDFECPPALYIIGYFEVERAGFASSFSRAQLSTMFRKNFHVMHAEDPHARRTGSDFPSIPLTAVSVSWLSSARAMLMRSVAAELALWRSARVRRAAGWNLRRA